MKAYLTGAAALLLGTSALAGTFAKGDDPAMAGWDGAKPASTVSSEGFGPVIDKGPATLTAAQYQDDNMATGGGGKANDAFAYADQAEPTPPVEPIDSVDPAMTGDPAGTGAPVDTIDSTTALGEASSAPVQTAALDLTPRPATANYPACEPGPGDDRCIQLYEPGVRVALANWTGTTGGFAGDGAVQTAMGGPDDEPGLDDHAADMAAADASAQPVVETAMTEPDPAIPAANGEAAYTGVGGPVMEDGYPPCSGAASDDRCIQLYERGVTGEGN